MKTDKNEDTNCDIQSRSQSDQDSYKSDELQDKQSIPVSSPALAKKASKLL